jgi:hypothetical protein
MCFNGWWTLSVQLRGSCGGRDFAMEGQEAWQGVETLNNTNPAKGGKPQNSKSVFKPQT